MSDGTTGDELLGKLLQANADIEASVEEFHNLGRAIGAVHDGMIREGVATEEATMLTIEWMECHLFDRLARAFGPLAESPDDRDEDAYDPEANP